MSDKAITQIKAELEKREKYWQEWNGRAANRIAKLEYENHELQAQVDAMPCYLTWKGYTDRFGYPEDCRRCQM